MARHTTDSFAAESLLQQLIRSELDVLRLTVPARWAGLFAQVRKLGIPWAPGGMVRRFRQDLRGLSPPEYRQPGLAIRPVTQQNVADFTALFSACWGSDALSYFAQPELDLLVPPELQKATMLRFFREELLKTAATHRGFVAYKHETPAGYLINRFWATGSETVSGGVLRAYRGSGVFLRLIRFIQAYCIEAGLHEGFAGAREQNQMSQILFQREGMHPFRADYILYLFPLLSVTQVPALRVPYNEVFPVAKLPELLPGLLEGYSLRQEQSRNLQAVPPEPPGQNDALYWQLRVPLRHSKRVLIQVQTRGPEQLYQLRYLDYRPTRGE